MCFGIIPFLQSYLLEFLAFLINGAFLFHRFFILPKKKLNEELRKIEEEKTQLMDELEEEAIRRKQKDRLEQN